jgi:hypothetical protein
MWPLALGCAVWVGLAKADDLSEFRAALSRENGGPRNSIFDTEFDRLQTQFRPTTDPLIVDPREFVAAQRLIVSRSHDMQSVGTLQAIHGQEIPVGMFATFERELARTFRTRLGLNDEASDLLAGLLEKQAVEMAGVSYAKYAEVAGRTLTLEGGAPARTLRETLDLLYATSKMRTGCDIPFIAGYALDDDHIIYIDQSVPEFKTFRNLKVPIHKLLNAHERIEKVLLDEFGATYPHAHQIALRVEKVFAEAIGTPWQAYDDYWGPMAEAIYARHYTKVPRELQMTPYLSFTDAASVATVHEMRAAYVAPQTCVR